MNIFQDNKKFWQTIKPLFSDKQHDLKRNIVIVENESVISDNKEVAEKFNTFFIEAVENLDIEPFNSPNDNISNLECDHDNIDIIINRYKTHPSIQAIKQNALITKKIDFVDVTSDNIEMEIR